MNSLIPKSAKKIISIILLLASSSIFANTTSQTNTKKTKNKTEVTKKTIKHQNKKTKEKTVKHKQSKPHRVKVIENNIPQLTNTPAQPTTSNTSYIEETPAIVRQNPTRLNINSYAAAAVDANTGEVLYSKNPDVQLPIASITKLMTAVVMLNANKNPSEYVTITSDDIDTQRNTFSRLKVGLAMQREELLLLALMSSENRAAHALGRTTFSGGTPQFIAMMNKTAKSIGMNNTQYFDPTGLTTENKSTALDLTKMVREAYKYKQIKEYSTTQNADVQLGPRYFHRYVNSDALVRNGNMPILLSKTGFINEAGHCLVIYTMIGNRPIIITLLNSRGTSSRANDAIKIRNYLMSK